MKYLQKLHDAGVRNIEMECVALAAMTHQVKMKGKNLKLEGEVEN